MSSFLHRISCFSQVSDRERFNLLRFLTYTLIFSFSPIVAILDGYLLGSWYLGGYFWHKILVSSSPG
jgi:hypothetical protein